MLSEEHHCMGFETPSKAHRASACFTTIALSTSFRHHGEDPNTYCQAEMWFSVTEAKAVVEILGKAIAETEAYQASRVKAPGADKAE